MSEVLKSIKTKITNTDWQSQRNRLLRAIFRLKINQVRHFAKNIIH